MKKLFISAMMLCAGIFSYAQLNVASIEKVQLPEGVTAMQAAISPDGSYVVISQNEKAGLQALDLSTNAIKQLTNNGSLLDVKFSDDSKTIVFRASTVGKDKLRRTALKSVNIVNGAEQTIVKETRDLQGFAVKGATVLSINKGKLASKSITAGSKVLSAPVVSIDKGRMMVTVNGSTKVVAPQGVEGQSYLWPVVSPDGTRIAYYLARQGAYVCNIDGSNPVYLGTVRAPQWYDNNTVVGMNDKDNGEFITSSKIVAVSADGKVAQKLTEDVSMAMYPSVSADGGKIAYTSANGELYIININK